MADEREGKKSTIWREPGGREGLLPEDSRKSGAAEPGETAPSFTLSHPVQYGGPHMWSSSFGNVAKVTCALHANAHQPEKIQCGQRMQNTSFISYAD